MRIHRIFGILLAAAVLCSATGCAGNAASVSSGAASLAPQSEAAPQSTASSAAGSDASEKGISAPVGSELKADLNGDGTEETIYYAADADDEENPVHSLSVNGTEYKDIVNNGVADVYIYFPDCTNYYVVDLDASDPYQELAIQDFGPSDDPTTFFFRYDGTSLSCIGYVTDLLSSESCTLDHAGTVQARLRLSLLQTWFATGVWRVQGDALQPAAQDLYTPWFYDGTTNFSDAPQVTVAQSIKVYAERDVSSSTSVWEPSDTPVTFPSTDNVEWVEIERGGETGWIHITDFCVLDNDGETDATVAFNGLFLAD